MSNPYPYQSVMGNFLYHLSKDYEAHSRLGNEKNILECIDIKLESDQISEFYAKLNQILDHFHFKHNGKGPQYHKDKWRQSFDNDFKYITLEGYNINLPKDRSIITIKVFDSGNKK